MEISLSIVLPDNADALDVQMAIIAAGNSARDALIFDGLPNVDQEYKLVNLTCATEKATLYRSE